MTQRIAMIFLVFCASMAQCQDRVEASRPFRAIVEVDANKNVCRAWLLPDDSKSDSTHWVRRKLPGSFVDEMGIAIFTSGVRQRKTSLAELVEGARLEALDLADLGLHDVDLEDLGRCNHLAELILSGNPISDDSIETIARTKHLKIVNVSETNITAAGLKKLREQRPELEIISDMRTCIEINGKIEELPSSEGSLAIGEVTGSFNQNSKGFAVNPASKSWHLKFRYGAGTPNDSGPRGHCTATFQSDGKITIVSSRKPVNSKRQTVVIYETASLEKTQLEAIFQAADEALMEAPKLPRGSNEDGHFLRLERADANPARIAHVHMKDFSYAPAAMLNFVGLVNKLLPSNEQIPLKQ